MALPDSLFQDEPQQNTPSTSKGGLPDSLFQDETPVQARNPSARPTFSNPAYIPLPNVDYANQLRKAAAFGGGALTEGAKMANRLGALALNGVPQLYQAAFKQPFPNIGQAAQQLTSPLQRTNPNAYSYGQMAGDVAPYLAVPELDLAKGLGKGIDMASSYIGKGGTSASDYLANTQLGKFIGRGLNNIGTGAIANAGISPLYNENENNLKSIQHNLLVGGAAGAVAPAALGVLGLGSRAVNAIGANPAKIAGAEGDAYNRIREETSKAGFKAEPENYRNTLQATLQEIKDSPEGHVHQNLEDDLSKRLNKIDSDLKKPHGFDVQGTHAVARGLDNKINSLYSSGDRDGARLYIDLKNALVKGDLLGSLRKQGLGPSADLFEQTQKNWAQNVIPLRDNPTSWGKLGGYAAIATALAHMGLPAPIETGAAAAFGLHTPAAIRNAFERFNSSYSGGPAAGLNTFQGAAKPLTLGAIQQMNANGDQSR